MAVTVIIAVKHKGWKGSIQLNRKKLFFLLYIYLAKTKCFISDVSLETYTEIERVRFFSKIHHQILCGAVCIERNLTVLNSFQFLFIVVLLLHISCTPQSHTAQYLISCLVLQFTANQGIYTGFLQPGFD